MNVSCPQCKTVFRVDPHKVPSGGARARCSVCGGVFEVQADGAGKPATPRTTPEPAAPKPPAPERSSEVSTGPGVEEPIEGGKAARPTPRPPEPEPTGEPTEAGPGGRPMPEGPAVGGASAAEEPPTSHGEAVQRPAPSTASSTEVDDEAGQEARPAEPVFGKPDPEARSRRLARALISDMVAYHPERQQVGLREGRLKELFREEIKKAWREYVEQVGLETAKKKPYFRDALNEILARGNSVF